MVPLFVPFCQNDPWIGLVPRNSRANISGGSLEPRVGNVLPEIDDVPSNENKNYLNPVERGRPLSPNERKTKLAGIKTLARKKERIHVSAATFFRSVACPPPFRRVLLCRHIRTAVR